MNNDYAHLISIIVPAYNVSTTIERTLNTLTAQTYSPFEIIVVNDASTDNTEQVARDFLSRSDSDFRIIAHTVNKGVSAARNTGLKAAHGRYVWFIDADDIADKNFLALLHEKAEKENADVVLGSYRIYFEREDYYRIRCIKLKRELSSARDYFPAWLLRKIPSNIWCCLFRRDFITENMLSFPEGCHSGEDEEFLVKALVASRSTCFVREPLYVQIDHDRPEGMFKPKREDWSVEEGSPKPQFRAVRYILRHSSDKRERSYAVSLYLSWAIVRQFKICARKKDKAGYEKCLRMLKHRKIREILLSTAKFFLRQPETPFKALMLLYFPKLYYVIKSII